MNPHPISARREKQVYFPEKGKYISVEIYHPAYVIILCAFNGTLAIGVDAPLRKTIQQKVLYISVLQIIKA